MKSPQFKKGYLYLAIILLLSLIVRLPYVDYGRFEGEMVRDIEIAESIDDKALSHGVLGKNSPDAIQQSFGPLYYYLIRFSLLFTTSAYYYPLMPYYLTMALNVATILLCFFFCKRYFGERTALIASSLYALSAWVVLHVSNVLTTPNYLPLFVILAFIAYYKVLIDHKDHYLFLFFVSIALEFQFHLSAILLLPVYATLFLFRRDLFKKKQLYLYALLSLALFIPYVATLVQTENYNLFSFIGNRYQSTYVTNFIEALGIPLMYTTPYLGKYLLGDYTLFSTSFFLFLYYFVIGVFSLLTIFSFVYIFKKILVHKQRALRYIPLVLWFIIPIFLAFILKKNISPHYLIILLPAQFIFMGIFFDYLIQKKKYFTYLFLFLIIFNFFFLLHFYNLVDNQGTKGIYGIPYKHKVELVTFIPHLLQDGAFVVNYYQSSGIVFNYLFALHGYNPKTKRIEFLEDFQEGILVVDSYSFYSPFKNGLPNEDKEYLKQFTHIPLKTYDLYLHTNHEPQKP